MTSPIDPLRGILCPLLTPFNDDLSIAVDLYLDHAQAMLDAGCAGLVPFGTTGEAPSITREERLNLLWALLENDIPPARMLPGAGMCSLAETADLSRAFLDAGCPAVLVLPPFFFKDVTGDGLRDYFARLIERIGEDARIVLYHIPQTSGVGLPPALVRRLKQDFPEQIVGVKDSAGDWNTTAALLNIDDLAVYSGSEEQLPKLFELGGAGAITASANLNAAAICDYATATLAGNAFDLTYLESGVLGARKAIREHGYIETPKRLLVARSADLRWRNVRPPLLSASQNASNSLADKLERFK